MQFAPNNEERFAIDHQPNALALPIQMGPIRVQCGSIEAKGQSTGQGHGKRECFHAGKIERRGVVSIQTTRLDPTKFCQLY